MLSINEAILFTIIMGGIIFFCRIFPFLFFRNTEEVYSKRKARFLQFVEKVVPPVAMTVLAFNALSSPLREDITQGIPVIAAAICTALVHIWKRNALVSIILGTFIYILLSEIL